MLEITDLRVAYNRVVKVLEGISISVPKGNIVAMLGANGSGKSTTLKAVSGMLRPENGAIIAGVVTFLEEDVTGLTAPNMVKRGVFHVMEGRFVFPDLTVKENLVMGSYSVRDRSLPAPDIKRCLSYFPRLETRMNVQAGYLSGGEQQMLAIGRALMAHPKLILLDEPSMGLSPLLVQEVFRIISEIRQIENQTILLVEQNVKLALKIADYGYVVEQGSIRLEGSARELGQNQKLREFYLGIGGGANSRIVSSDPAHTGENIS